MLATEKISVTIGRDELAHAKRLASHLGVSLSGFITEAVRLRIEEQARREAALEVIGGFGPEDRPSAAETQALLERWSVGTPPAAGRRSKSKTKLRRNPR
jgi:hypothetical protein